MAIDNQTIKRVASLARLKIEEKDLETVHAEFNGILNWVEQLQEVDTQNVEPLFSVNEEPLVIRGYDFYRYLMTVHKGTKVDFLKQAGTTRGFAKKMFGQIYDAIFEEAKDVEDMFERYYKLEYHDVSHFVSMHYCIPEKEVKHYTDALATGKYRVIDFSSLDYGSSSFENLFTSDEMFVRMYNWLNWKEDEDKN